MTWRPLDCGIHESSLRDGACWRCESVRAELVRAPAPVAEPAPHRVVARIERARARSNARKVGDCRHRATQEMRDAIVQRALTGEAVGRLARESGFSRAAIYVWLEKARHMKEAA